MAYVDRRGKTHVSVSDAASGYAAKHTASRNAIGKIVGGSSGSNYAREQEAKRNTAVGQASKLEAAKRQTTNFFSRDHVGNVTIASTGERVQSPSIVEQVKKFGNNKANKQSLASYAKNLYGAGKSIAAGQELTGKQKEAVERFSTSKEFKHSNMAKEIQRRGTDLSTLLKVKAASVGWRPDTGEGVPVIGSVVQGLYSVTDIGNAAGQVTHGVERWTQKNENAPGGSSFLPSIPVGAGIVVQSIEDDPIRFATELLVMDRVGKIPGKMKVKTADTYAKAKPGISKMMKDETAQVNLKGSDYGNRAVDRWDKLAAKKAKDEPSFELVEDSNGNLVLKEVQVKNPSVKKETTHTDKLAAKKAKDEPSFEFVEDTNGNLVLKEVQVKNPSVKKETTHTPSDREVSTGNGQKMVMLTKSETMLETLSKMEPVEVWDLSTVTKPRIETKISQFKAAQKASIAREKMKSHKLKLKEKPKVEIKSKVAGRKNVVPKHKTTQAQKNAAKRKHVDTVEEISDTAKLEKVKRDIKIMQLEKEEVAAKTVKVAKKTHASRTETKTKTENVLKTKTDRASKVLQKTETKKDAMYLPVVVSVPRVVAVPAYAPFVQNDAVADVKSMNGAIEQAERLSTFNDTSADTKADTQTDARSVKPPTNKPPIKKVINDTSSPKPEDAGVSETTAVSRKKIIVPFKNKKKQLPVRDIPDISDSRAHRMIKNTLGDMESFFGGSTKKPTTKKRATKRKSKTR
jgi:hypothetical protein